MGNSRPIIRTGVFVIYVAPIAATMNDIELLIDIGGMENGVSAARN